MSLPSTGGRSWRETSRTRCSLEAVPTASERSYHGDRLPWEYSPPAEAAAKKFLRLRNRLVPYLYALAREAHDEGLPMARAMWLAYPDAEPAATFDRQYLLGDDLLVAPIATPGPVATKEVWFPPGEDAWVDIFTGERYEAGQVATVEAPLDRMPVFARTGAVLPLKPLGDRAGDSEARREIRVYAGDEGAFELYDDAGEGLGYRADEFGRTPLRYETRPNGHRFVIEGMDGDYPGRPAERAYDVTFVGVEAPEQVVVSGDGRTADWTYDADAREVTVSVDPRPVSARVVVTVA
jgi:alpha-glucosidase (family GH31 glycosyl hydrolase)